MKSVYHYVCYLSEVIGERLSGSLQEKKATTWIVAKLKEFQLKSIIHEFSSSSSTYAIFQFFFLLAALISFFYLQFYFYYKIAFIIVEIILAVLF